MTSVDPLHAAVESTNVFLYCYGDRQDLHSFPTRRSSDLKFSTSCLGRGDAKVDGKDMSTYYRSEEHTSELQSRFELVCRLLLEKKNRHLSCGTDATETALYGSAICQGRIHLALVAGRPAL